MATDEGAQNVPGAAVGWGWFDEKERQVDEQRNEDGYTREEMFRVYYQAFTTTQGQVVLRDLMKFRRTTFFDPARGFYDGAAQGFYNSGMNDLITHIERMMNLAGAR